MSASRRKLSWLVYLASQRLPELVPVLSSMQYDCITFLHSQYASGKDTWTVLENMLDLLPRKILENGAPRELLRYIARAIETEFVEKPYEAGKTRIILSKILPIYSESFLMRILGNPARADCHS